MRRLSRSTGFTLNVAEAIRSSLALGVPIAVGIGFARTDLGMLASLGAVAGLYGRDVVFASRAKLQAWMVLGVTAAFGLGFFARLLPTPGIALAVAALAGVAVFVANTLMIGPPGGYLIVLVGVIGTSLPSSAPAWIPFMVLSGALWTWLLNQGHMIRWGQEIQRQAVAEAVRQTGKLLLHENDPQETRRGGTPKDFDALLASLRRLESLLGDSRSEATAAETSHFRKIARTIDELSRCYRQFIHHRHSLPCQTTDVFDRGARWLADFPGSAAGIPTTVLRQRIASDWPASDAASAQCGRLLTQLIQLLDPSELKRHEMPVANRPGGRRQRIFRSSLRIHSYSVVVALRSSAAALISVAISSGLGLERSYWAALTAVVILHNVISAQGVLRKGSNRILGTLAGAVFGGLLLVLPLGNWTIAAVLMILQFLLTLSLSKSYALTVFLVTPLALIVSMYSTPGFDPFQLTLARVLDTVIGGIVGIVIALTLLPHSATKGIPRAVLQSLLAVQELLAQASPAANGSLTTSEPKLRRLSQANANLRELLGNSLADQKKHEPDQVAALRELATRTEEITFLTRAGVLSGAEVTAIRTELSPLLRDVDALAGSAIPQAKPAHAKVPQAKVPHAKAPHAKAPHAKVPHAKAARRIRRTAEQIAGQS